MDNSTVLIEVFGADLICASCANAPSARDTYEWLEAAIGRKYPGQAFNIEYIDIDSEIEDDRKSNIAEQVRNDEFFYPLVLINEDMIGEGHIQLKPVFNALEKHGFVAEN
ncbi:YuzD family protein [Sporosarcina sp. G11-34]|uniref:YuzD family protein n=1 Tax=Sporosarcina sp. G11-34 TaxID=2849605 RepID=UPI0022A8DC7E|nr:DUF1462 family protein [Sporosarcina sp. G11-34]MCZ2260456.1 YuzD family protein [Sporosarcina sp. G11-34]